MPQPQPATPNRNPPIPGPLPSDFYRAAMLPEKAGDKAGDFAHAEWTQNARFRDIHDRPTKIDQTHPDNRPVRYCAISLLDRASQERQEDASAQPLVLTRLSCLVGGPLPDWNDLTGREPKEIRDLFRQGAAILYREAAIQAQMQTAAAETALVPAAIPAPVDEPAIPAPAPVR